MPDAVGIVEIVAGGSVICDAVQLTSCPAHRHTTVRKRVSDCIMGNALAVVARQLVLPVGITVAVGRRNTVHRFGSDITAVIVIVACGVAVVARRNSFELIERIVGIGVGNAANRHRSNVAVVVVGVSGVQQRCAALRITHAGGQRRRAAAADVQIRNASAQAADGR